MALNITTNQFGHAAEASVPDCSFAFDNTLGPVVLKQCRAFDFTLLFEQTLLSLVPSLILILLAAVRLFHVFRRSVKTLPSLLHGSKMVMMVASALLEPQLIVSGHHDMLRRPTTSITCCIGFAVHPTNKHVSARHNRFVDGLDSSMLVITL